MREIFPSRKSMRTPFGASTGTPPPLPTPEMRPNHRTRSPRLRISSATIRISAQVLARSTNHSRKSLASPVAVAIDGPGDPGEELAVWGYQLGEGLDITPVLRIGCSLDCLHVGGRSGCLLVHSRYLDQLRV